MACRRSLGGLTADSAQKMATSTSFQVRSGNEATTHTSKPSLWSTNGTFPVPRSIVVNSFSCVPHRENSPTIFSICGSILADHSSNNIFAVARRENECYTAQPPATNDSETRSATPSACYIRSRSKSPAFCARRWMEHLSVVSAPTVILPNL